MKIKLRLISIILIAMIGVAVVNITPASATHENDHRFTVYGRVFNDKGAASSRTLVVVKDNTDKALGSAETGSKGSYKILLHLHNEDRGKELTIIANNIEKKITLSFDVSDAKAERMAKVNFGISEDTDIDKDSSRKIIFATIFFTVLGVGVYFIYSGRKKKEHQEQKKAENKLKAKKGKTKKKKR
tara:strand:+ start:2323 stop:2880 length:558 start_codon:yes stop_codon:yes gene_type:complete